MGLLEWLGRPCTPALGVRFYKRRSWVARSAAYWGRSLSPIPCVQCSMDSEASRGKDQAPELRSSFPGITE